MRNGSVVSAKPLGRLRFKADATGMHSQQLRDSRSNRRRVRSNLWRAQDQAGIDICDLISRIIDALQRLPQKNNGIRALPLRIRRWKQDAYIWGGNRSQ